MGKQTRTSSFGVSGREGHDASAFYQRRLFQDMPALRLDPPLDLGAPGPDVPAADPALWVNQIYCASAERLAHVPSESVGLCFTSPPYNNGKSYDMDLTLREYLTLIGRVGREVYRVLKPGGRYVINMANQGRKQYVNMVAYYVALHLDLGFIQMGEHIWRKGKAASNNCAWGSFRSARAPRARDVHEMVLVFAKGTPTRPERGTSDISKDDFIQGTISIWEIAPVSARRVGHPAPFPQELARRVIQMYSFVEDVVLDPFCGSGTTCVAAAETGRHFVGYDNDPHSCDLARRYVARASSFTPGKGCIRDGITDTAATERTGRGPQSRSAIGTVGCTEPAGEVRGVPAGAG